MRPKLLLGLTVLSALALWASDKITPLNVKEGLWVTRVPVGPAPNTPSPCVLSPGAKFPPRHSNWNRPGGCQTEIRPIVNTRGPDGDRTSSMNRPPSHGSNRHTPGCFPAMRNFGPQRHQRSVSSVKMANAVAGSVETVTLTVTRSEAGGIIVLRDPRAGSSSVPHDRGSRPTDRSRRIPLPPASREAGRMAPSVTDRSVPARPLRPLARGSIRCAGALADAGSAPEGSGRGRRQFPRRGGAAPSEGQRPPGGSGRPARRV